MRYFSGTFILLLFSVFLLPGCSETPVETDLINKQNVLLKEPGPGAVIYLYERNWVRVYYLRDLGVFMTIGLNNISDFCAGTGGRDWKTYKEIHLPDHLRVIEQTKGRDITIMIWKPDPWPTGYTTCDLINMMGEPFAMGTGNIKSLDSDVLSAPDENCMKVISYRVNGKLTGADSRVYHLNFFYKCTWDGIDPSTIKYNINLDLIPSGKS